jgi:paraquat-inducible protein A
MDEEDFLCPTLSPAVAMLLKACHCCGKVHQIPNLERFEAAACTRCRATIHSARPNPLSRFVAFPAVIAFLLYWPAILAPILTTSRLGHDHVTSLLAGTLSLIAEGEWFVGIVVLLFSIVLPLVKILLLLELCLIRMLHQKHQAWTYRAMEFVGKWGMLDVMVLAFLVMLVKLGNVVSFKIGPAVIAFVGCVFSSMLASLWFDAHALWDEK